MKCIGNEIRLADCPYISHFCTHTEDIGVQCIPINPSGKKISSGHIADNNIIMMI